MDELHVEPIYCVEVAALLVTCGMCGHPALVEYEDLDVERGLVEAAEAFPECEECGCVMDATTATFSASINKDARK